jgi:15-cis-phytoene synthase|uniref:phytoene/squalene synthase family protein n=1 Tax=Candidatus Nanopelagicus sp. TaxID=2518620 RepID=UPI004049A20B
MDEQTAAGITDPRLRASYQKCKELNSKHGKTYYLATLLLPKEKRPYVHALYGFARYADEIVDDLSSQLSESEKAEKLNNWGNLVLADLKSGSSQDPIAAALVDTATKFSIPISYFEAFLHSMKMDLTVTEYHSYQDLYEYVYGSAAVIGLQMVSILGTGSAAEFEAAKIAAEKLGVAFQLANFIRDVGEDLERGRVYLPITELQSHGVTRQMLENKVVTPQIKNALKEQIARVRKLQLESAPGIQLLSAKSRECIKAASELYCGIVDEVEKIDYEVFSKRAKTSTFRRMKVAIPAYFRSKVAK